MIYFIFKELKNKMKTLILVQTYFSKEDEIKIREKFRYERNIVIMYMLHFIRSKIKILQKDDILIIIKIMKEDISIIKKIRI